VNCEEKLDSRYRKFLVMIIGFGKQSFHSYFDDMDPVRKIELTAILISQLNSRLICSMHAYLEILGGHWIMPFFRWETTRR
jgi:hypothetical protein